MTSGRSVRLRWSVLGGCLLLAATVGALATYLATSVNSGATTVRGTVVGVNRDATAIVFREAPAGPSTDGRSYEIRSPAWVDRDGAVHREGRPECIVPGSSEGRRVELAFVEVDGDAVGLGTFPQVVWIQCLD
jgi:hypothetical protein